MQDPVIDHLFRNVRHCHGIPVIARVRRIYQIHLKLYVPAGGFIGQPDKTPSIFSVSFS